MTNRFAIVVLACFGFATTTNADEGDDTLGRQLSKSDLVVLGNIWTKPEAIKKEAGVVRHNCLFKIDEVLKGDIELKSNKIAVNIVRFEAHALDTHPLITKKAKCILFLKGIGEKPTGWETSDFWFGIQHPSPWMVRSLKRLVRSKVSQESKNQSGLMKVGSRVSNQPFDEPRSYGKHALASIEVFPCGFHVGRKHGHTRLQSISK